MALSNRAQIMDIIFLPVVLMSLAIAFLFIILIANAILPPLLNFGNLTTTDFGKNIMAIPSIEDMMAFGLTIAVILVYLITAVVLRVHPVTAGIGMVLLIFAVYLAGIANNVVQSVFLVNNTYINQTVTSAPGLVLVSNNIVTIVLCVGVMCILLAYLAFRNKGMNPNEF
jgi:hypothetical protein